METRNSPGDGFEYDFEAMVNPERLRHYDQKVQEWIERIRPGDTVLVACHKDGDGISGGAVCAAFLKILFGDQINITFAHSLPSSQTFYAQAEQAQHVLITDLWIHNTEAGQSGLLALSEQGKNFLVFDHHDERLDDFDPINDQPHSMEPNPRIPETRMNRAGAGSFAYVSPKRLGCKSEHFPAALIAFGMLARTGKVDLERWKQLLLIAIGGDYAKDGWDNFCFEHDKVAEKGQYIGRLLNAADNLKDPSRLITLMCQNPDLSEIMRSPEMEMLIRLDIKMSEALLGAIDPESRLVLYHIDESEEEEMDPEDPENICVHPPILHKRFSDKVIEETRGEKTSIITQFERDEQGEINSIHISARDIQPGYHHNMGVLMAELAENGGGHANAGGATIPVMRGLNPHQVLQGAIDRLWGLLRVRNLV